MNRMNHLTQAYSQAPWRSQIQMIGLFLLFLVFAGIIAGVYLSVTARAATIGREIQQLQKDIRNAERVNADLNSKLAFLSSSDQMEKRAFQLGFQPVGIAEPLYLKVHGYGGRQPANLAPAPVVAPLPPPSMPSEYTEPLFNWLQREFQRSSLFQMSRQFLKVKVR
jgi:cell division protein FtsL